MELIRDFAKLGKNDAALAGGKGASLGEMTQAGIAVPPGFVVLAMAFEKFQEETDLGVEIDSILHSVNHQKIHTIENASEKIEALILEAEMPTDIAGEIKKYFKKLNSKYVAVRSSATAEDSQSAAWAGQLESYLNTTEDKLLENIKRCWASLFTPQAIFYRFEKNLHTQKISVAVVVQKMIESESSGIAFSVHPVTQDRNQMIIEAALGLGEAIVSGQITPDSYVVEKEPRRIIDKNIQTQTKGLYQSKTGENEWRDIPKEQGKKQVLTNKQILALAETILKIENHYGFPCDIEWALEKGKFYIVQSRPITTLSQKATVGKLVFEKSITRDWPLFIVEMLHEGFTKEFKKQFGFAYIEVFFDCYTDHLDIYRVPEEHIEKMRAFILSRLEKDHKFITKCSQKLKQLFSKFTATVSKIDKTKLSLLSNKQLTHAISKFIKAHTELEPTFVINFWFPIQMESHPDKDKWQKEIAIAARTRAETEKVGPEGDRIATKLAKEVSQRMFNSEKYAKFLLLKEAEDFLTNRTLPNRNTLEKRSKGFIYGSLGIKFLDLKEYASKEGYTVKSATTDAATTDSVKGNTAYPGLVRGRVRVILSKNKINEVKTGEVIVTTMTTPEYMPALKKAVAFVTDEGGITCHAAIVSREMRKPCIIGTKIATQVFKDGDIVEVDANEGIVKILQRKR